MKPGYYVAYRTKGGRYLRMLSQCFPVQHEAVSDDWLLKQVQDWKEFEQKENPTKDVVLIQVIEG